MFQFPAFAPCGLCIQPQVTGYEPCRVAPFGNPRIKGCLHLPEAYRSLPRPSSLPRAKASTLRPFLLDFYFRLAVIGALAKFAAARLYCNCTSTAMYIYGTPGFLALLLFQQTNTALPDAACRLVLQ